METRDSSRVTVITYDEYLALMKSIQDTQNILNENRKTLDKILLQVEMLKSSNGGKYGDNSY